MRRWLPLFIFLLLTSCGRDYRYAYVSPELKQMPAATYSIERIDIRNTEALMIDKTALSNSLVSVFDIVMRQGGLENKQPADILVDLFVEVESFDLLRNDQSISFIVVLKKPDVELARFLISSDRKDILFDKNRLVKVFQQILMELRRRE